MLVRSLVMAAGVFVAFGAAVASAGAQGASPTPAPSATPTFIDRAYDGKFHFNVAPYLWLPTIKSNVQYNVPVSRKAENVEGSIYVPPADYVASLNSAAMLSFTARQGELMGFGDFIYTNASASASINGNVTGPLGKLPIPVGVTTNSRLAVSIWEVGAGVSVAHGHNADLNLFAAYRAFPLNLTLDYDASVGARVPFTRSGSVSDHQYADDWVFGLKGNAYFGDGHWQVPYYADIGAGATQQTWEGYTGIGYTFNHGQSIVGLYRGLHYYGFPSYSMIQKLDLEGPLLGYSMPL